MYVEQVRLSNFWCFGKEPSEISLSEDLTVFIGANGSGKTAVLNGLLRLFGQTGDQRRVRRSDFHLDKEKGEIESGQLLFVEAMIAFPELEDDSADDSPGVAQFFRHMTITEDGIPKCRIRLEAIWTDDGTIEGDIEQACYVITSLDNPFDNKDKNKLNPADRARIRITYVPAIRNATAQIIGILKASIWKAIAWSDKLKKVHSDARESLDSVFQSEEALEEITSKLNDRWSEVHKAGTDSSILFSPMDAAFDKFSSRIEPRFSPTESGGDRPIHQLSDGQRSLFQISLTSAVLDLEASINDGDCTGFTDESLVIPDLSLLAIEEPENNLAPFYLSRILRQLKDIASRHNMQAVISSHSASTLARVEPEHIRYFRKDSKARVLVNLITLPDDATEAGKYVREAVKAYPELYFAKFVVLGEGDSELIVLPKLAEAADLLIDPSFVAIVPLGGRHVNHFWRLLNDLNIPYATLLDYDYGRDGGGWGRIKYACKQLRQIEQLDEENYKLIMGNPDSGSPPEDENVQSWIKLLKEKNVFFSTPLDIDLLMLDKFPDEYRVLDSGATGPSGDDAAPAKQAALKKKGTLDSYGSEWDDDFLWYRYLFLGRGKPASHLKAMALASADNLLENTPDVIQELFDCIKEHTEIDDY